MLLLHEFRAKKYLCPDKKSFNAKEAKKLEFGDEVECLNKTYAFLNPDLWFKTDFIQSSFIKHWRELQKMEEKKSRGPRGDDRGKGRERGRGDPRGIGGDPRGGATKRIQR